MSNPTTPRSRSRNTQTQEILLQKLKNKSNLISKKAKRDTESIANDSCSLIAMKNVHEASRIESVKYITRTPLLNLSIINEKHDYYKFVNDLQFEMNHEELDNQVPTQQEINDRKGRLEETCDVVNLALVHRRRERSKSQYAFNWCDDREFVRLESSCGGRH